jgi:uncharacterized protein (TIGR03086 family)
MNPLASYRRAQDGFDTVLASVPADEWEAPSTCADWSVRDVAGHVIWGQDQLRCWATGETYGGPDGGPGSPHPAELARDDPLATWRRARTACAAVLTDETLDRIISLPGLGDRTIESMVTIVFNDTFIHTWDIGHALGVAAQLPSDLVAVSHAWARDSIFRVPGFFGPEMTPPPDADEQTRWLAFLGRAAWEPVATRRKEGIAT